MLEDILKYWYWWQTGIVLLIGAILLARKIQSHSPIVGLAFAWACFSALRIFASPVSPYLDESNQWQAVLDCSTASALASLFIYLFAARALPMIRWSILFQVVALVNAIALIIGSFFGKPFGILMNASMSGCFNVSLLPLFFHGKKRPGISILLLVISILVTAQSQPIGLLILLTEIVIFRAGYRKSAVGFWLISGTLALMILGDRFLNTSGRLNIWTTAMHWWWNQSSVFLGSGLGTFFAIGPTFNRPDVFIWLHSDWLQVLFEQGVIGFVLIAVLFLRAIFNARIRSRPAIQYALITYGVWGIANMPLHYPLSALYGAVLFNYAYGVKE
jgi:hypothetical protein